MIAKGKATCGRCKHEMDKKQREDNKQAFLENIHAIKLDIFEKAKKGSGVSQHMEFVECLLNPFFIRLV